MPAEQDNFWLTYPIICDFYKNGGCTHREEFSGGTVITPVFCGVSTCPFEKGF